METIKLYAGKAWEWYKAIVSKYPVKSNLVAIGAGFVLGWWLM